MQAAFVKPGPLIRIEQVWHEIVGVAWRVRVEKVASWVDPETKVAARVLGESELSKTPERVSIEILNSSNVTKVKPL